MEKVIPRFVAHTLLLFPGRIHGQLDAGGRRGRGPEESSDRVRQGAVEFLRRAGGLSPFEWPSGACISPEFS